MRKLFVCLSIITIAGFFISCRDQNSAAKLVEAEDMELTGYQIASEGEINYIELADDEGEARFNFPYQSGYYAIDVRYLAESVGQNTYTMYINDNQVVAWLGKDLDDQWHFLSEQHWHVPNHVQINKGDKIRIVAFSNKGSKVSFDYVKFTPSVREEVQTVSRKFVEVKNEAETPIPLDVDKMITIYPQEYEGAIRNPLKGFRGYEDGEGFSTLQKEYIKWNKLENSASDGVEKIIQVCNEEWEGVEDKNLKVIPRVYLEWPGQGRFWPEDMTPGDYTSDQFKERVVAFIKKLGQAWDNDPRVAYVEMGLIGQWGEMEFPNTRDDIKKAIAEQFDASFQKKLVMIRWPNTYYDHIYNFGYYWDSFAHWDQEYCGYNISLTAPKWKTAVIGGEAAYNWGNDDIQPGKDPDASLIDPNHRDYVIDRIRRLHTNHLGWISRYSKDDEDVLAGAEIMQKAFGYRFVIEEVRYPKTVNNDDPFTIYFDVKNTGSTPFYYNWPVEISLLNPTSKEPVWKTACQHLDIRAWLPGDNWNDKTNTYEIPAKTYKVHQNLSIAGVPEGEYILAVAILDPAGNLPAARFAIENYYKGGRHPIGKIGIHQTVEQYEISAFDDIQLDRSLHYLVGKE